MPCSGCARRREKMRKAYLAAKHGIAAALGGERAPTHKPAPQQQKRKGTSQ